MALAAQDPLGARRDTLFGGRLVLWQPEAGPRTTIDTLLLASFAASGRRGRRVLDLGAGVGALGLSAWHLGLGDVLQLVECDADLAHLAGLNAELACAPARVDVVDVAELRRRACADIVLCNPPYFAPGSARPPAAPAAQRADIGELPPFLRAAATALGSRGRAVFSYPARSLTELSTAARRVGLEPKRLRFVHADAESPARLVLVELKPGRPGGLEVEAPLFEWCAPGRRSFEVDALIAHPAADRR